MEKAYITQTQADAIETLRKGGLENDDFIILRVKCNGGGSASSVIVSMELDKLVRAVYIGYVVEENFKIGDIVMHKHTGAMQEVTIYNIHFINNEYVDRINLRRVTHEELKIKREEKVWEQMDRKVNDWKYGDCYRMTSRQEDVYLVDCEDSEVTARSRYKQGLILGIYPVESFFEFGDESNDN